MAPHDSDRARGSCDAPGYGRIFVSQVEVPNVLASLVWRGRVVVHSDEAAEAYRRRRGRQSLGLGSATLTVCVSVKASMSPCPEKDVR